MKHYPSTDSRIVDHGVSGYWLGCKPGTVDCLRYLRIIDTSGQADKDGVLTTPKSEINRNANILYFKDPTSYENAMNMKLDSNVKADWYRRQELLFRDNKFNNNELIELRKQFTNSREKEIEVPEMRSHNNHIEKKRKSKIKKKSGKRKT